MPKQVEVFSYTSKEAIRLFVSDLQEKGHLPKSGKSSVELAWDSSVFIVTVETTV